MKIFKLTILLFFVILFFANFTHDAYLGVTTVRYNSDSNHLEFEIKLTAHDLEEAIYNVNHTTIVLDEEGKYEANKEFVFRYISSKFNVYLNDAHRKLTLVGYEVQLDDVIWIYLESDCPDKIISFTLTNTLLIDSFDEQHNITHFELNENLKTTYVYTKNNKTKQIDWN